MISRKQAHAIVEFIPRIPSHASQHYKGKTLREAAKAFETKNRGEPANRFEPGRETLRVVNQIFNFARQESHIEKSPFRALKIKQPPSTITKSKTRELANHTFSIEHLNSFFALPLYTGCIDDEMNSNKRGTYIIRRHRYWAPIISLFTGMRMNEILQLEAEDFKLDNHNIHYIEVNDIDVGVVINPGNKKRLKTKNSVRKIPLHPFLVECGFFAWVNKKKRTGRIFPEADAGKSEKPSNLFSKRFKTNLLAAKVYKSRQRTFHSFRHTFNDALRDAGVQAEHRKALNGWSEGDSMDSNYGQGVSVELLYSEISRVEYKGLILDHIKNPISFGLVVK